MALQKFLLLVVFLSNLFLSSINAQERAPKALSLLSFPTLSEQRIAQLETTVSYESLRFEPYGRVFPGRWEVGVYFTPWVSSTEQVLNLYEKGSPLDISPFYVYPGTNDGIIGTFQENEVVALTKRPGIAYLHGEIARQFYSGWRLGIGYTFTREPKPRKLTSRDFPDRLSPDEFAFVTETGVKGGHLNAHMSYTFNRRRRFRPAIGLNAVTQIFYGQRGTISFYDGATNVLTEMGRFTPRNTRSLPNIFFLAQVSLQYQLTQHFSIGLEGASPLSNNVLVGVPLVSMGGRYSFARGW